MPATAGSVLASPDRHGADDTCATQRPQTSSSAASACPIQTLRNCSAGEVDRPCSAQSHVANFGSCVPAGVSELNVTSTKIPKVVVATTTTTTTTKTYAAVEL